jgi:hypothetical protein
VAHLPPISYRWDIIAGVHDALGHAGVEQVLAYMHQFYHWRNIMADIARYVKQCDACQKRKLVLPPLPELQEPVIHGPFDHLHIDLCGPFPTPIVDVHGQITWPKTPQKAWVVLMIDYFTKAAEFVCACGESCAKVGTLLADVQLMLTTSTPAAGDACHSNRLAMATLSKYVICCLLSREHCR